MISPEHPTPLLQAAEELLGARRVEEALFAFDRAKHAGEDPDRLSGGLWMTHMLRGDFEAAWRDSDALRARNAPDPHRMWSGEPIAGKRVVVRCLHGFGDAVQMLRYAPLLRSLAAEVSYEVPPRLLPIAHCFAGVGHVFTWGEQAPPHPPACDLQIEVMELPFLFRTRVEDLPIACRYLRIPEDDLQQAASRMGETTRPRVGLVWTAGGWNPSRCVPFAEFAPLLANPDVEFWSLEHRHEDTHDLRRQVEGTGDGMLALAATIAHLDLVVTVDTLAAHLAGAMGKPACVLLQHAADWRWGHARSDSPWYPSLELLRQPEPGDWTSAIRAAAERIAALTR